MLHFCDGRIVVDIGPLYPTVETVSRRAWSAFIAKKNAKFVERIVENVVKDNKRRNIILNARAGVFIVTSNMHIIHVTLLLRFHKREIVDQLIIISREINIETLTMYS